MDIPTIVRRIIGNIEPCGDSEIDEDHYKNPYRTCISY